jgi:hypothetical protein
MPRLFASWRRLPRRRHPTHSLTGCRRVHPCAPRRSTDRIESRMIDLNPVTKTKTKTCMCPTHLYRLPDHESENPGLLGRVRPRSHGSLQTDRGGFRTTCRVKRRDVLVSGLKCVTDGEMYSCIRDAGQVVGLRASVTHLHPRSAERRSRPSPGSARCS